LIPPEATVEAISHVLACVPTTPRIIENSTLGVQYPSLDLAVVKARDD
jgi:hypothetical protein